MCRGKGIGHWITHSPITPLDSSAASRSATDRLPQAPRTGSPSREAFAWYFHFAPATSLEVKT
jgi:hypothetical protein